MFCTDDKHAGEIQREGHINYNVARAMELGVGEIDAVKLATLNAARHFRLEDEIGSITPGLPSGYSFGGGSAGNEA